MLINFGVIRKLRLHQVTPPLSTALVGSRLAAVLMAETVVEVVNTDVQLPLVGSRLAKEGIMNLITSGLTDSVDGETLVDSTFTQRLNCIRRYLEFFFSENQVQFSSIAEAFTSESTMRAFINSASLSSRPHAVSSLEKVNGLLRRKLPESSKYVFKATQRVPLFLNKARKKASNLYTASLRKNKDAEHLKIIKTATIQNAGSGFAMIRGQRGELQRRFSLLVQAAASFVGEVRLPEKIACDLMKELSHKAFDSTYKLRTIDEEWAWILENCNDDISESRDTSKLLEGHRLLAKSKAGMFFNLDIDDVNLSSSHGNDLAGEFLRLARYPSAWLTESTRILFLCIQLCVKPERGKHSLTHCTLDLVTISISLSPQMQAKRF